MGFQRAAFGFVVCDHPSLDDFVAFVVKEFTLHGQHYVLTEERTDECDKAVSELGCSFNDFTSAATHIIYHDDIEADPQNENEFCYKNNKKIKISEITTCALMIWVAKYDDEDDSQSSDYHLDQDDILDLFAWKKILVDQDRIEEDAQLELFSNCCS